MAKSPNSIEQMNYEQAFTELENVVKLLEDNPSSLEESITLFERGQALAKQCAQLLEKAELRVQKLTGDTSMSINPEDVT